MENYDNLRCCTISRSPMPKVWSRFQSSVLSSSSAETSVYLQAIHALVSGAYLKPSTVLSHISKTDRLLRLEANLRKNHKGIPTTKNIVEWKVEADAKVKRENEEAEKIGMVGYWLKPCRLRYRLTDVLEDRKEKPKDRRTIDRTRFVYLSQGYTGSYP